MITWTNDLACFCSYSLVLEVCCGSHGIWYGAWTVVGVWKSLRVFRCCLISIPLLSFQTVVIYEDKCLHIMRGEMSSIKDKGVIVVQIAMVVTLVM